MVWSVSQPVASSNLFVLRIQQMLPKWKGNCNDVNPYSHYFSNRFEYYKLYRAGGVVSLTTEKGKLE